MKKIFPLLLFTSFLSFSQDKSQCEGRAMPYWAHGINSRIEGEVPTLKKAFEKIQLEKTHIEPADGFITLRLNISQTGFLCSLESFQIDKNYVETDFNDGKLIVELEDIARDLRQWKRDKEFKTYNLIRLKIKNGKIEEIF